jgi:ferredoxin
MKKVSIEPGCITCGACEFIAPDVFEVSDISHVKKNADLSQDLLIKAAALACPVNVIKYDE